MKSLKTKINESFYKNAGGMSHPTTTEELQREIMARLDRGQYNLNDIDVSRITDMSLVFSTIHEYKKYDQLLDKIDISRWDVSSVKDMKRMFQGCTKFNHDLSKWDVGRVRNMTYMFANCTNFNSDLSKWNTSKVGYMEDMFRNCDKFNCDLSDWDVSNVDDMTNIFRGSGMKELPDWYKNHKYGY